MAYLSITRLGLNIQEKLNKLNAGNLTLAELDELKQLVAELNERVIILNYKAEEKIILKTAGEILEKPVEVKQVTTPEPVSIAPIKIHITPSKPLQEEKTIAVSIPEPKKEHTEIVQPVIEKVVAEPVQPNLQQELFNQSTIAQPVQEPIEIAKEKTISTEEKPASGKLTLVERLQKTKIHDLKTAIGLNQKFLFINFLFEGENSSYNDAIEKLNAMPTAADARHLIRELAYVYNWNFEDDNVILFTEYIERRHM